MGYALVSEDAEWVTHRFTRMRNELRLGLRECEMSYALVYEDAELVTHGLLVRTQTPQ